MIEFFIPMIPPTATHQQKKINWAKRLIYESDQTKTARAKLTAHLAGHKPQEPIEGPITMSVIWVYPLVKGRKDGEPKATRPDIDNIQKLLLDCMTALGFWKDDAQITVMMVSKYYGEIPGIYIKLEMRCLDDKT